MIKMKNKKYNHNMGHYLKPHTNKVLKICKKFSETGFWDDNGSDYGCQDTEVREIYMQCLLDKLKEDIERIPKENEWGLYDPNSIGAKSVGKQMSQKLKELFEEIDNAKNFEITEIYEYYGFEQYEI
jgi:hypothetical protein